ncbi:LAFA_0G24146g1_1 [Lachancea sp. 'fantastica']|nr:LAFA_0G24146g1_1 [Lachancea sp. 'fantastica']
MSRAKEIEEKMSLQASLQALFNSNKLKAADWVQNEVGGECNRDLSSSKAAFYKLPVMAMGAGLSLEQALADAGPSEDDIATVGEFIDSDKKVSSLAKTKKRNPAPGQGSNSANSMHRITKDDTRAMIALKRKMKGSQRHEIRKNLEDKKNGQFKAKEGETTLDTPDSDSDSERRVEKTQKKSFGLLFQGKQKKNKKRK